MTHNTLDIFPWNDNFNTDIPQIDEQHKRLVQLLNELACQFALDSETINIDKIFNELIDYTIYHFETEEKIWHQYFEQSTENLEHRREHQKFITILQALIEDKETYSTYEVAEKTLSFLVRWLTAHILESDRFMAYAVIEIQSGASLEQARTSATGKMSNFTREMIGIVLSVYEKLTSNTLKLMHELSRYKQLESQYIATNNELSRQRAFLKTLIHTLPDPIWLKDIQGYYLACNDRFEQFFGYSEADIIGRSDFDFVDQALAEKFRYFDKLAIDKGQAVINEEWVTYAIDGHRELLETTKTPMYDEHGNLLGVLGIGHDITQRKQIEEELKSSESRLLEAQRIAQIGNWEYDIKRDKLFWSDEVFRIFGFERSTFKPSYAAFLETIHPEDRETVDSAYQRSLQTREPYSISHRIILPDGSTKFVFERGQSDYDASGNALVSKGTVHDITLIKKQQEQLNWMAYHDPLTELPNRVLFIDRLNQAMAHVERLNGLLAVIYLDLDDFKSVNEQYGHQAGDELIIEISKQISHIMRSGDTLSRIGGDEFAIILTDLTDHESCIDIIDRLIEAGSTNFYIGDNTLRVSSSMGVSYFPQNEKLDAEQLMRQSSQAMFKAKQSGKQQFQFFDPEQDRSIRIHHKTLEQIKNGFERKEFVLYYQPKVNMCTGDIIGMEALIRWQHPHKGLVPPAEFIPVIENHALMIDVSYWVIATAIKQLETWNKSGLSLHVSVNIDALTLQQQDFLDHILEQLHSCSHVQANNIELEILETSALDNVDKITELINNCRKLGIKFSLDDFGTGYSSLTYLKRISSDILKIDQSFVRDMLHNADSLVILEGIIGLSRAFKRLVIAEGVETIEHGNKLIQMGCELGQGYAIARPMPAESVPDWLDAWKTPKSWCQKCR